MSLPNQISKRLTPGIAMLGIYLVSLTSGCCGIGAGCGVGGYGSGAIVNAGCGGCGSGGCGTQGCSSGGCSSGACEVAGCGGGPGSCHTGCGLKNLIYPLISPRLACGSGCGQIYLGEWISDPPDCCDPCGQGGCYVGPQQVCNSPPLIVAAVHSVGRGVSGILGAFLGGIGCGPCDLLTCGGCSSCRGGAAIHSGNSGYIDTGCGAGCCGAGCSGAGCSGAGCSGGGCCGGCASSSTAGQTIVHENPQLAAGPNQLPQQIAGRNGVVRSAEHQIRTNHRRPPHRAFSRRFR